MRAFLTSIVLALHLVGCSAFANMNGGHMNDVIIFYLSFGVDTFTPVTVDLIEKQADCRFVLTPESDQAQDLRALFERAADGSLDNRVVRVKAIGLSPEPIFVDIDGGLLRGKEERKLPEPAFGALRSMLEAMAKQEGCAE